MEGIDPVRQLGILPKRSDPKVFADYLLTLGMKTRVAEQPEGWSLWSDNEDHLERALAKNCEATSTDQRIRAMPQPSTLRRSSVARNWSSIKSTARTFAR